MRCLFVLALALLVPGFVAADTEETLRYYLAKSDVGHVDFSRRAEALPGEHEITSTDRKRHDPAADFHAESTADAPEARPGRALVNSQGRKPLGSIHTQDFSPARGGRSKAIA